MAEATAAIDVPSLNELMARAEYLEERRRALGDDLAAARVKETCLIEELEALRRARIEGNARDAQLEKAEAALASNRRTRQRAEEALVSVEAELTQKRNAIDGLHRDRERARQTEAAGELRDAADLVAEEWLQMVSDLPVLLHKRVELARRSARDYPLAPAIAVLKLDDLARQVRQRYVGPEGEAVRSGPHHTAITSWLVRLLSGPVTSSSTANSALRDSGIVE